MTPKVNVFAHRGFSGSYPENTAAAFRKAIDLGVEGIEFDVHLTADRGLVLIHDDTVDRVTNGHGRVETMTLSQLKKLDAGSWKSPQFKGTKLLTLAEGLDIMASCARLNVHLKATSASRSLLVSLAIHELETRGLFKSAFVASDEDTVILAKQIWPSLKTCCLTGQTEATYIERSLALGCHILQPGNAAVDTRFVERAHASRLEVNPFYADDIEEMRRLIRCGVDGILTNYPDLLMRVREE